ncbi:MAG: undecaprenyldiphospho-muramoylpentapeptide beta-N-acetylglucosaminyltransferase [Candidatus Pacebacteria bacterium]|nr:undecaprenyldiphospho-muramoylpentapeptide beta-N-acetylglucosaminyltransferase [Candidatus Paceibacterota bacterium]
MDSTNTVIFLASGGTGGHFYPAISLSQVLSQRGYSVSVITDSRSLVYSKNVLNVQFHSVKSSTITKKSISKLFSSVIKIIVGFIQSVYLIRKYRPHIVIGFGGYPSFPVVAAAVVMRIPIILHEQNAILGRANRSFAKRAELIAATFPLVNENDLTKPVIVTGNPVREPFKLLARRPYTSSENGSSFRIVITGGSQGANIFSQILPFVIVSLPPRYKSRIRITQQCRSEDLTMVTKIYADAGVVAETMVFINDLANKLDLAHLAICRAGASTVSELAVSGVPSILVPYPNSTDDHQLINAHFISKAEAGWLITQQEFTVERVSKLLMELMDNSELLTVAAARARNLGVPNAAEHLADLVELVGARP